MTVLKDGIARLRSGDWIAAHEIAQRDTTRFGAWFHGIVHLVEGDVGNARYWFRQAGRPFPEDGDSEKELATLDQELG